MYTDAAGYIVIYTCYVHENISVDLVIQLDQARLPQWEIVFCIMCSKIEKYQFVGRDRLLMQCL